MWRFVVSLDPRQSLLGAEYSQGGTNTHLGINYVLDNDMFSKSSGGRDNADKVLIVLTDGESSRIEESKYIEELDMSSTYCIHIVLAAHRTYVYEVQNNPPKYPSACKHWRHAL